MSSIDTLDQLTKWVASERKRLAAANYPPTRVILSAKMAAQLGDPIEVAGLPCSVDTRRGIDDDQRDDVALELGTFILSCNCGECDFCIEKAVREAKAFHDD